MSLRTAVRAAAAAVLAAAAFSRVALLQNAPLQSAPAPLQTTTLDAAWRAWNWTARSLPERAHERDDDDDNAWTFGGCGEILAELTVHRTATIGRGTVKDVYLGSWGVEHEHVAVLRLRSPVYQGDFSSGISRLIALHGHPTIWPLRAACPRWPGYTETNSAIYNRTVARARELGYLAVLNTAVTPLSGWGGLEQLDDALERTPCAYANNWRTRLRIAVGFLRAVAFLHNSGTELNPFRHALVLKDYKIGQYLLDDDMLPRLNDAEALPLAASAADVREDLCRAPAVLEHILRPAPLPPALANALDRVLAACVNEETAAVSAGWMAETLLRAVPLDDLV